jgi:benzoyl-CoA reductase/2-hydroxyglutaryl-CoA dehydratase subunit BcrC/BadD/HgdB
MMALSAETIVPDRRIKAAKLAEILSRRRSKAAAAAKLAEIHSRINEPQSGSDLTMTMTTSSRRTRTML